MNVTNAGRMRPTFYILPPTNVQIPKFERRTRVVRNLGLASLLAVLMLPLTARSDDKLVLDLPASQSAAETTQNSTIESDPPSRFQQPRTDTAVPNRHGS